MASLEQQVPDVPDVLVGVWDLAATSAGFGDCHEASIGYRADGRYVTKSGDQIVAGRYSARPVARSLGRSDAPNAMRRQRFMVAQRPEVHNEQPNCQGFSADDVIAASPGTARIEIEAAVGSEPTRAWIYFGDENAAPVAELVRRTSRK